MSFNEFNIFELEIMAILLLPFVLAIVLSKVIINNASKLGALDKPKGRKIHLTPIPSLGGLAVVGGICLGSLPFVQFEIHDTLLFTLACTLSLSIVGAYDDIKDISPSLRLIVEVMLVSVLVQFADLSIAPLFSPFGITELNPWVDWILTCIFCVAMINAFNFMDGINGLAGGIFTINFIVLAICFFTCGDYELGVLSAISATATRGFLLFNFNKASIFLGDSGSIALGFLNVVLVLFLVDRTSIIKSNWFIFDSIAIASILIIPTIDMIRVVVNRIRNGKSPMQGDKTHLHHLFLEKTNSHKKSTISILSFHVALILTLSLIHI